MTATDYFRDVWPRVVERRYAGGGWMVALAEMDIEVMGELLRIPVGHKLTREQALAYPGDVQHVWLRDETSGTGLHPHPYPLPTGEGADAG